MSKPAYYSLRRLPPYQGTIQVVELPGFRAMSRDGITWQVQIRNQGLRYSLHGTWRANGTGDLIETGRTAPIIAALRDQPALPFPLADKMELWLLHANDTLPLALLCSAPPTLNPPQTRDANWFPAMRDGAGFVAPSLEAGSREVSESGPPVSHRKVLARCVRAAAAPIPKAQWFRRDEQGAGQGLSGLNLDASLEGRALEVELFPELLVREHWDTQVKRDLVRDYHHWQAPNLLTHPGLRRETRDGLERAACRQAEKIYAVRRLLPEMVNEDLIKSALVEAVIRKAAAPV